MDKDELKRLAKDRARAEKILERTFGFKKFYDEQWEAIRRLLMGERILMIERTGFGKSLCYQFTATLFDGMTIIFTPLVALMRDQVQGLRQKGIEADCINSERGADENMDTLESAKTGKVKILYIAPERQENFEWRNIINDLRISMIVIDEAHTISVWGHDFRPAFRRIVDLVRLLPRESPLLATTATATKRVQKDIEEQIGHDIHTIRGNLVRDNFKLHVIKVQSEEEKMVWVAKHLRELPGTGLIYTGTRVGTEIYSKWLQYNHLNVISYNAGLDSAARMDIEQGLKANKWKSVVSTNALGMGIDKPDIRFIIHTQIPASPVHYYQEIGRAGRDGLETQIVLFYNTCVNNKDGIQCDRHLPMSFIDGAKPSKDKYDDVIKALKEEPLTEREMVCRTNLRSGQIRAIRADLIEQGIIKEVLAGKKKTYEYQFNAPTLDTKPFEALRDAKMKDLEAMVGYVFTDVPRMKYLCEYLGDDTSGDFSGCDNTTEEKWSVEMDETWQASIKEFRETDHPTIKCASRFSKIVDGVAASYYGVSEVGEALHRSKYEHGGFFPDFLLRLTLKAYRKTFGRKHLDYVMFVPPTVSGGLVEDFARRVASTLMVPFSKAITKTRTTEMQKIFHNAYGKRDNVKDAFRLDGASPDISGKTILLIDDIYDTGATLKEIGRMLSKSGAAEIIPLVIAKTVASDNDD